MSLDIGKKGAIVIYDDEAKVYLLKQAWSFKTLLETYTYLKVLIVSKKVELIVIGEAFGMMHIVRVHTRYYGIIELLAEQLNVAMYYLNDMHARCVVLGKGNGRRKDLIHEKYKGETEDISDACSFISAYYIEINGVDESFGQPTVKGREFPEISDTPGN